MFMCSPVVLIIAVSPWRYVPAQYMPIGGDRWRS